jgi:hypothetical protein
MQVNAVKSVCFFAFALLASFAMANDSTSLPMKKLKPDADNGGLKLPQGFSAVTVTNELGSNRHIAVNPNGDIYVKLGRLKDGKGIVVLRDEDGDGKAQIVKSFGNYTGTGIAIKNGFLYA